MSLELSYAGSKVTHLQSLVTSLNSTAPLAPIWMETAFPISRFGIRARQEERFVLEPIHNRSGVGSMVTVADVNGHGTMDIITSTQARHLRFLGQAIFSSHSREKVLMDAAN